MATRTKSPAAVGSVRGKLSEGRLRALIDRDRATNAIVTSRRNKISRTHYAKLLDCTQSALTRFGPVFAEYERELGIATGPLRHLSAMREWLTAAYDARELGIRNGKLDRTVFQTYFGLRGGTFMVRHAAIRALFDEFDARVEHEGYLPLVKQEELDRIRAALAGRPTLNKDRMTLNLSELAKVTQVPNIRFRDKPFADAIAARQAEIMAEVEASKIDPFLHGRVFHFSDLAPIWPTRFLERVGIRFKQVAVGWAEAKGPYLQLFKALKWIGLSSNPHCRAVVAEATGRGRVLTAGEWEDALFAYREHLVTGIAAGGTADRAIDSAIAQLRTMLDGLSSGRVVPATSTPLPGVKYGRYRNKHRPSVAEAGPVDRNRAEADYVAFARDRYLEVCRGSGTDLGMEESDQFINGLAIEIGASRDLPADPVAAIRLVLERRLNVLRTCATAIVDAAVEVHQRGRELLSLAQIDGARFEADYIGGALTNYERYQLVRSFFPNPTEAADGQVQQGIANLLSLIIQRHRGIPPRGGANVGAYGQFFSKRYLEYGGVQTIVPMLHPDPETVGAILTLYLIESGANVSVGRTLDRECIESSDLKGYRRITGYKARAQGKPIIVDLPDTSPAVRAIEWLLSAGGRLQACAASDDTDRLFLMRIGKRVQLMTSHWYTYWFKSFVASTPGLEAISLVPSMIRPSVLLHAALGDDGRLAAGMAIGQHGLVVSQGYQQKWPTRLLYDENIRRFQEAFETLVMSGIEDAASKLGITVEQFEARLGHLRATGLGTFCMDQRGRPGEHGETCSTLDCWNDCPNLLIVAEIEAIATLQLWQRSLRAFQPEWERDRPERWDEIWLPWLCLTDVVEEKMVRGPMIRIWKNAQRRADEISALPGYVAPRPW
ncbi:hypothetical protein [Parvibaculum sp.]|uniref:hypothetical protein n=1 Tax=Parvibaculum sp. TaxID=2024848 RepID=UPI001D826E40|nr:hypothetical protein [Parvibaculum sp.]MBX3488610.1 hypothetical protein [Parvibaculum sp.]